MTQSIRRMLMGAAGAAGGAGGYVIEGSGLFDGTSGYLARTFSTGGTPKTFTIGGSFKRGPIGVDTTILYCDDGASADDFFVDITATDNLRVVYRDTANALEFETISTFVLRDTSAAYLWAITCDTTPATPIFKIFVTLDHLSSDFDVTALFGTDPAAALEQNDESSFLQNTSECWVGRTRTLDRYWGGYVSQFFIMDGVVITDPVTDGLWEVSSDGYIQMLDISGKTFGTQGGLYEGGTNVSRGVDTSSNAGSADATVTYIGANEDTADQTVYTFSSEAIGDAAADRKVVICVSMSGSATQGISSVTLGGTTMAELVEITNTDNETVCGIYALDLASGTTADVVVTNIRSTGRCGITVYNVNGAGSISDTISVAFAAGGTDPSVLTHTVPAGGVSIGHIATNNPTSTYTWVGLTEDVDKAVEGTFTHSSASAAQSSYQSALTVTVDRTSEGTSKGSACAVSWGLGNCAQVAGTITATNDSSTNDADNDYGNYCVMNPLDLGSAMTIANGNLGCTYAGDNNGQCFGTLPIPSTGKYYFEVDIGGSGGTAAGYGVLASNELLNTHARINTGSRPGGNGVNFQVSNGVTRIDGSDIAYDSGAADNSIIGVAIDADNGTIWFSDDDTWLDSATIAEVIAGTTTNAAETGRDYGAAIYFPSMYHTASGGHTATFNFGATAFTSTQPTGYKALATQNFPDPAIPDPTEHHHVGLVNHDGTSTAGTCSFDLDDYEWTAIIKNRDNAESWFVVNSITGVTKYWHWNTSTTLTTDSNVLTVSGTTYTLGSTLLVDNYVVEIHKAGLQAATASNTDGSINTNNTSFNLVSGFFMCDFTGTEANATIGTGLPSGEAEFVVAKRYGTGAQSSVCEHVAVTVGEYLDMTATAAETAWAALWDSTKPASGLISLGDTVYNNSSEGVFLCGWTSIEGYSAFGSYEGNGSTDGSMINVGFKPASVVLKSIDSTSSWHKYDTSREGYNVDNDRLNFDTTAAEGTADEIDILSNGVKLRIATDPNVAETNIYSMWGGTPIQGPEPASNTSQGRAR